MKAKFYDPLVRATLISTRPAIYIAFGSELAYACCTTYATRGSFVAHWLLVVGAISSKCDTSTGTTSTSSGTGY
jgi:hypothetical protein